MLLLTPLMPIRASILARGLVGVVVVIRPILVPIGICSQQGRLATLHVDAAFQSLISTEGANFFTAVQKPKEWAFQCHNRSKTFDKCSSIHHYTTCIMMSLASSIRRSVLQRVHDHGILVQSPLCGSESDGRNSLTHFFRRSARCLGVKSLISSSGSNHVVKKRVNAIASII
jgi:hypothetical protein